jgi:hypothetical protein
MEHHERFVSKRVEVDAIRWTGDNAVAVSVFARRVYFYLIDEDDRKHSDDPEATAQVFDHLHGTWILVKTGQWIIKGTKGEYYPCDPEVFAEKYDHMEGC